MWTDSLFKKRGQESYTLYSFACNKRNPMLFVKLSYHERKFIPQVKMIYILTKSHLVSKYHMSLFGPGET